MKRLLSIILILTVTISMVSCFNSGKKQDGKKDKQEEKELELSTDPPKPLVFDEGTDMKTKLLALDNVISVEEHEGTYDETESYMIVFERPLDPEDPSKGTFELHVGFCYTGDDTPNVFYCTGYGWHVMPERFTPSCGTISGKYNYIMPEYRYYGFSAPDGLDNSKPELWEYLTSENAAADFHFVIGQFKRILTGKWCFTGGSKGGVATLLQSMYYPDDADIYYAISAPVMYSNDYPGLFEYMYESIGDDIYGPEEAARIRDLVLQFQVEAIKHSDVLEERYLEKVKDYLGDDLYDEIEDKDMFWDIEVLMAGFGVWQMESGGLFRASSIEQLEGAMSEKDEEERLNSILSLIHAMDDDPKFFTTGSFYYPYVIQQQSELGLFSMDFSYIREELRKQGEEDALYITEEMEKELYARSILTPEQMKTMKYDPKIMEDLKKHLETTDRQIIVINGTADLWNAYTPEQPDNPNVHIYEIPGMGHEGDGEKPEEVYEMLREVLG